MSAFPSSEIHVLQRPQAGKSCGQGEKNDLFQFTLSLFSFFLRLFSFKDAELVQYENVAAFDTLVLLRKREM